MCGELGQRGQGVSLLPAMPAKVTAMRKALLGTEKIGKVYKVHSALAEPPLGSCLTPMPTALTLPGKGRHRVGLASHGEGRVGEEDQGKSSNQGV